MDLYPSERRRLDYIEGDLRAEEPKLASMFDVFTRLARTDGKPPVESQLLEGGAWRGDSIASHRGHRRPILIATIVLAILIAIIALGFA